MASRVLLVSIRLYGQHKGLVRFIAFVNDFQRVKNVKVHFAVTFLSL